MPLVEVKLKTERVIYQISYKPGDVVPVREEIAIKWAAAGICEYPIKPKSGAKK